MSRRDNVAPATFQRTRLTPFPAGASTVNVARAVIRRISYKIMGISFRPETQKLLEDRLDKGGYADADELLVAALAALDEQGEMDSATLDAINEAEDDIKHGRIYDWAEVRASLERQFPNK